MNAIQIRIKILRTENLDRWQELKDKVLEISTNLEKAICGDTVVYQSFYTESHQITINILGEFSPVDETDLLMKYDNYPDFIKTELPRIVKETLPNVAYSLKLGQMQFISLA